MHAYYENLLHKFKLFSSFFPDHNQPFEHTIRRTVQKFEETGSVCYATRTYQRSAGSFENIADVRDSVEGNPNLSIPCRS